MGLAHRLRICLAATTGVAAAASVALASSVEAGAPAELLLPDLRTVAPGGYSLQLKHSPKRGTTALRISNKVANKGTGPMELYATPATETGGPGGDTDCTEGEYANPPGADRDANQAIYEDTNGNDEFDPGPDQVGGAPKVGCFEYHNAHGHWHFQDFAQFRLEEVATGEVVAGTQPSRKIGFCILDGERRYILPGSPTTGVYPSGTGCAQGEPSADPGPIGLSVGWADLYTYSLPGQRLDISGVPAGTYCLVSIANPPAGASEIEESDATNNERRRQVAIHPAKREATWVGQGCPDPTP